MTLVALPSAAQAATQRIVYSPFDSAGNIRIPTGKAKKGECFTSSLTMARTEALRCRRGGNLLDPCFKAPRSRYVVVCVSAPSSPGVRLKVPSLPKERNLNVPSAWAFTVEAGECTLVVGATTVTPHGRLNYGCPGGLFLFGNAIQELPNWVIWAGHDPQAADAQLIPISIIWY